MRQEIVDSIVSFHDRETDSDLPICNKRLINETSKYSSTQEPIWHVYINDIRLTKTNKYSISYRCLECDNITTISTTRFLRKVRNESEKCGICKLENMNLCKERIRNGNAEKVIKSPKQIKYVPRIHHEKSIEEFEQLPELYQNSYMLHHLSKDEYQRILPRIISIGNGVYSHMDRYEFWSVYKVNNQMRFTSMMFDPVTNSVFKANQPILNCENCGNNWRAKSLEGFKNQYKILCHTCKLCNQTFKIRPIKNYIGENLIFQSKLEKKFVDWCNENSIIVRNGPYIDYFHNGKSHRYRVDFIVGNILVEVKDFHIWHKNQVESGKWKAKQDAVESAISTNNDYTKFVLLTPHNWNQMLTEIKLYLHKKVKI